MEQFKVGDHVENTRTHEHGIVTAVHPTYLVDNNYTWFESNVRAYVRRTEEEAWDAIAPMVVSALMKLSKHGGWLERKDLRHESYKILGAAGVKMTNQVKDRVSTIVNGLVEASGLLPMIRGW